MKKLFALILNFFHSLFGKQKEKTRGFFSGYFWYSAKQNVCYNELALWFGPQFRNFAQLDDGRIVCYTEMNSKEKKVSGNWDDYVFLGHGRWHHNEKRWS